LPWTAPKTWTAVVVTVSDLNTHVRDNELALHEGALALASQANGDWVQAASASAIARVQPYTPHLVINTTPVGNVGAGVDTLQSYALAAGLLGTAGWGIEITAVVKYAANANTKQAWLYFGATAIAVGVQAAWNNVACVLRATVIRTGAATQVALGSTSSGTGSANPSATFSEPAETLANAITIAVKGEATDNDDVISKLLMVRLVHTPT